MSYDGKTGGPYKFARRAEPDDIEAQVEALKELQKQLSFMAQRKIPDKRDSLLSFWVGCLIVVGHRIVTAFKKKWRPR